MRSTIIDIPIYTFFQLYTLPFVPDIEYTCLKVLWLCAGLDDKMGALDFLGKLAPDLEGETIEALQVVLQIACEDESLATFRLL